MDLVSIIVPVYNVEQYIQECVNSIIAQTYHNIEIILVDDGSPDRCPQMCDEYVKIDSRIRVIHKANGGLSDARNAGICAANGEYVCFCDSDDILSPHFVQTLMGMAENKCIISCESVSFDGNKETTIPYYHRKESMSVYTSTEYLIGILKKTNDPSCCNKLFHKTIIGNARFDIGKTNEDILFLFKIIKDPIKVKHANLGLYKYRVNPNSITHTFNDSSLNYYYNGRYIYHLCANCKQLAEPAFIYYLTCAFDICASISRYGLYKKQPYRKVMREASTFLICNLNHLVDNSEHDYLFWIWHTLYYWIKSHI